MSKWISLAGMIVVLALAFGLDIAVAFIRAENERSFDIGLWRLIALFDVVELAFAVSIVAFVWFFLFKGMQSAMISSIALIVGLMLFFSFQLRMLFPNLSTEIFFGPLDRFAIVTPLTYLFHTGALFAVMGAAGLLRAIARFRAGTHAQVPSNP